MERHARRGAGQGQGTRGAGAVQAKAPGLELGVALQRTGGCVLRPACAHRLWAARLTWIGEGSVRPGARSVMVTGRDSR
jgi:hypothetical protein